MGIPCYSVIPKEVQTKKWGGNSLCAGRVNMKFCNDVDLQGGK